GESGPATPISILAYSKENAVQKLGFWYYIFGETSLHKAMRGLPITSRSSHGRHTRGSSMTIEIFRPGSENDSQQIDDFARHLIAALEPIMPENRDVYFRP
ncbi:MAG: exosortase-associated EpsI family protein, partial [bacterium]